MTFPQTINLAALLTLLAMFFGQAPAAETTNTVESAARRGLALVTRAADNWQKNKTCFSCHHQTLPMFAVVESARPGFPPDKAWLKSQADTTHRYFQDRIKDMDEGEYATLRVRVPSGGDDDAVLAWCHGAGVTPTEKSAAGATRTTVRPRNSKATKPPAASSIVPTS